MTEKVQNVPLILLYHHHVGGVVCVYVSLGYGIYTSPGVFSPHGPMFYI